MPTIDLRRFDTKNGKKTNPKAPGTDLASLLNKDISFGNGELNDKKKESFYLELSSLLQAGINLKGSLELIVSGLAKPKDKEQYLEIQKAVLGGDALSKALQQSKKFSMYEVYSIQIGEETGKLTEILYDLASFYQNKVKQRRKIIAALTYPSLVILTSIGAVFFMLKFVIPMFSDLFKRFGGQLPWITQQIVALSSALENNFYLIILTLAAITTAVLLTRKTEAFRRIFSLLVLRIPVMGNIVQKIYIARFCNSMRLLISAHLPLLRAIALTRQMVQYYPIESTLRKIEEDIMNGGTLNQSLQQFKIYPPKMVQFIKVGEETNQLDYFFGKISDQYVEEIEYKTSALKSILDPLIILFLGLVVGIILVAMYLPLSQMSNSFQ